MVDVALFTGNCAPKSDNRVRTAPVKAIQLEYTYQFYTSDNTLISDSFIHTVWWTDGPGLVDHVS